MYGMPYICHSVREYKTRVWDAIHALYLSMSYCVNSSCHAWWTLQWLLLQHAFQWSVPEPLHLQYFAYAYHLLSRWRLRTLPGPPVGWLARAPAKVMSRMMRHRAFRHWVDTHGLIYRVCVLIIPTHHHHKQSAWMYINCLPADCQMMKGCTYQSHTLAKETPFGLVNDQPAITRHIDKHLSGYGGLYQER